MKFGKKWPAIVIGVLGAVAAEVWPVVQGKSWDEMKHLQWVPILVPILVGILSHRVTVPRALAADLYDTLQALTDEHQASSEGHEKVSSVLVGQLGQEAASAHERTVERINAMIGAHPQPQMPEIPGGYIETEDEKARKGWNPYSYV